MQTSEVLNRAADLIEERGWGQGAETWAHRAEITGPLCLEGGVMAAAGVAHWQLYTECPAFRAVAVYLDRTPMPKSRDAADQVWYWNDQRDRTAAEVIEVLRACAVIEAAKEQETAPVEVTA